MKKLNIILLLALIYYCNICNSQAQICVARELRVSNMSGKLIFGNGTILNDIPIHLSKDVTGEKIIKTVITDENGKFTFGKVRSGKYYIIIQDVEFLKNLTFLAKIKKKYELKQPIGIKITMFPDTPGNCSIAETIML